MKKTLLFLSLFVAVMTTAWAQEVTFDFKGNPWGLPLGSGSGETAEAGNVEEITQDGVVLTFDQATASTPARMWTGPQLRVYKNSNVTVKAPAGKVVTKAVWTATGTKYYGLTVGDVAVDATAGWTGAQAEVTFLVTVNGRYNTLVVTLANEGSEPTPDPDPTPDPTPDPDAPAQLWTSPFDANQGNFTTENKVLPTELSYVWNWAGANYGMKASAYVGKAYATEAWLVSPVLDLTAATDCNLIFSQCANYFKAQENFTAACKVMVKESTAADWTELAYEGLPSGTSWDFVEATASLKAYEGKKVQFAFVYTSTAELAGTWEVKALAITGKGSVVEDVPEVATPVYTTIAELKNAATATEVFVKYEFAELLVTGVAISNGNSSVYVTDGVEGMLFYGKGETTLKQGDKISGYMESGLKLYYGLTEITGAVYENVKVLSSGNPVEAKVLTFSEIGTDNGVKVYENMLVKLENITFAAEALNNKNITMVDDVDNELTLRDNFNVLADFVFDTTKSYNVTAVVSSYNGTPQLYPLSADAIEVITNLQATELTWAKDEVVVLPGEEWDGNNPFSTNSDAALTFSSSNEAVATVDNQGLVTVKGYGSAVITVEAPETEQNLAAKASYTLYVIEGEGTFEKPYNITDAQYYLGKVTEKVWVKGTICGSYVSNKLNTNVTEAVASNLAIGNTDNNLPVQLPTGQVRNDLNLVNNPTNMDKTVWLFGNIEKYFSVAGVKNVTDYSFDGENTLTGIESVETAPAAAKTIYSLDGRVLNRLVKGINIVNGKKVLVK